MVYIKAIFILMGFILGWKSVDIYREVTLIKPCKERGYINVNKTRIICSVMENNNDR